MAKKTPVTSQAALCPCESGAVYSACCSRFVADFAGTPAPDAEHLMRSRYSAFVLEQRDYLLATWHVSTRPSQLDFESGCRWLGLQVKAFSCVDETHAEVEFVARYKLQGRAVRLHERSRFVKEQGRWFYLDGDQF
ncbi:hypothetical protein HS961_22195 [Comamonas piscis]|uniref:UPF0225 protein HS961_22195 n=1 Tax=Comamonas piscis TaxID=1562974 RepID=A0A7G5EMW2_9BURK|nr:YchJ family metal-binding protein [Comamonas piscis]QMV75337.1 hypothetical protein HS961_22195 [Comamonas piscis]WSO33835.1 YchJ family metal-binding protein [Comamonas piscis]